MMSRLDRTEADAHRGDPVWLRQQSGNLVGLPIHLPADAPGTRRYL